MNLVFRVTPQRRLIFVHHAIEQMTSFAQHGWSDKEAGGVLLGRHLLDSGDIVVDEVTTPQHLDRRSRFSFFRSKKHEVLAREQWQQQMNTTAYLGLWHTHPEEDPAPSGVDLADWQQAVSRDTFEGERLFFPIVGTRRVRVWCLSRRGSLKELKLEVKRG
ncbi:Mov34/MPN/PAD-1 family protein [Ralstonia wenshanensis]|uniref:Mov34/MPN/PAD-1 family protein n=1 Tax=Ralstonia wenshanensis TaxID=2842456 RepID=UPI001E5AC433|nr:Mov34/MPN/PAD-1 family protein [Ralstonia wenshanensis]UGS90966.1 Mov34/MPN/PAD-1 family protein [Ralstonia wenshanensis]